MIALIDSDIIAYRCAASAENDPEEVAVFRVNDLVRRILHETNATSYIAFLSGETNFRYDLYPEYKANRKDKPKPKHLQLCKEVLVTEWKARITDGIEADDALGIQQDKGGEETIICSIDKDLLQVPGRHYNFVRQQESFVSTIDGWRNFYCQIITGDATDNIPAYDGKFRTKTPKFVQRLLDPIFKMTNPLEMYNYCFSIYSNYNDLAPEEKKMVLDELHRNAKLLYIMQDHEEDYWEPPCRTMDDGQMEDFEDSSSLLLDKQLDDGLQNMTP